MLQEQTIIVLCLYIFTFFTYEREGGREGGRDGSEGIDAKKAYCGMHVGMNLQTVERRGLNNKQSNNSVGINLILSTPHANSWGIWELIPSMEGG